MEDKSCAEWNIPVLFLSARALAYEILARSAPLSPRRQQQLLSIYKTDREQKVLQGSTLIVLRRMNLLTRARVFIFRARNSHRNKGERLEFEARF